MKINEILIPDAMQIQAYAKTIAEECGPYLANYTQPVYRGIRLNSITAEFGKYRCPTNRRPLNSDRNVHLLADEWFQSVFGVPYRSNSVFVSGSPATAATYGTVYEFFPVGQYSFCWSPLIEDFTMVISDELTNSGTEPMQIDDPEAEGKVTKIMDDSRYLDGAWDAAVKSTNEIMVHCPSYFAVGKKVAEEIRKYLK